MGMSLVLCAKPEIQETQNEFVMRNAGAVYTLDRQNAFHLKRSEYKGREIWAKRFGVAYVIFRPEGDSWYFDTKQDEHWKSGPWTSQIVRSGGDVTLRAESKGEHFSILREYTLRGDSPDLEVRIKIIISGQNNIHWVTAGSPFPHDKVWLRYVAEIDNGAIRNRLKALRGNPFVPYKNGNFEWAHQWQNLSAVGSYDPETDTGALLLVNPEKPWPVRAGVRGNLKKQNVAGYMGFSAYNFSDAGEGRGLLDFEFKIHPFNGDPEKLNGEYLQEFRRTMERLNLFSRKTATGKLLAGAGENGIAVWQDYSDAMVFPGEPAPEERSERVDLAAARGETAMFQLVVKPQSGLSAVTLNTVPLSNGKESLGVDWNVVSFADGALLTKDEDRTENQRRHVIGDTETSMIGRVPDLLLEDRETVCPAGQAQPFFVRIKVPGNAVPGVYEGKVNLLSGKTLIASVPVCLRVWNFSIEKRTLTAALDFWMRYQAHRDAAVRRELFQQTEKLIAAHRGGERWVPSPVPEWDAAGNLTSVDYSKFDAGAEKAFRVYGHNFVIARCFMLGFGHEPRDTVFGKKAEILTPLWKRKLLAFAVDFKKHLEKKGWEKKVVFDLFDEPHPRYYSILQQTIDLLKSVSPDFRYTYAGAFTPALNGYINFWNVPMTAGNYTSRYNLRQMREKGGEVTVYNPPHYANNDLLIRVRGNYAWLWNENINYLYQWLVNTWGEFGERGSDNNRMASWVFPVGNRVCSTLRLEATLSGIQDYEYFSLLKSEKERLAEKAPALSKRAGMLLEQAGKLSWRTPLDERCVIVSLDPAEYHRVHRETAELLDEMSRH